VGRAAGTLVVAALVLEQGACRDPEPGLRDTSCHRRGVCSAASGSSEETSGGTAGLGGSGSAGNAGGGPRAGSTPRGTSGESGAGGEGTGSSEGFSEIICRSLGEDERCRVEGSGDELVVRGDVLTPMRSYRGGEVRVLADGTIACAGCDCSSGRDARRVTCPDAVVAPAFVNPHDHVAYAHEPPRPGSAERYDHRHDWRLGLRGHAALAYEGGATPAARAAHEVRMLLDGTTAIAGGAGHAGLIRNLDVVGLEGAVRVAPAGSDTFPLDDADGLLLRAGCAYGAGRTRSEEALRFGAYLPHLGEGVDAEAANEVRCALESSLVRSSTAVVHAIAVDATLARAIAARRGIVVWSPRSNLALYGNTAPLPLLRRSGVEIALGTDWLLSGSMNVRRELACARSFSERYLDAELDDRALFFMATASAARAAGASVALGRIEPGFFADLQVLRRRGLEPHTAVITAGPADMKLVLRAGVALYGDPATVGALAGDGCETLEVCGTTKSVCFAETGRTLSELAEASPYPLVACTEPPNEPSCVPARPGEYDGIASDDDGDGDGVPNELDACPLVFDPVRPFDDGRQADGDGDGLGDACDPCPLDVSEGCTGRSPDDGDDDGIESAADRCPLEADSGNADSDGDGVGDACDFCSAPNPGVTHCPLPVAALRDRAHAEHPPRHALVRLEEVSVVAVRPDAGGARGYYVVDGRAEFSGIFVFTGGLPPGVSPGDRVTLGGRLDLYQGTDEIVSGAIAELVAGTPGEPLLVEAESIGDEGSLSGHYESMLVRVVDVTVANANPDAPSDYDEFLLEGALRVDDLIDPSLDNDLPAGTRFQSITGVLGRSFGHYKIWPRDAGDLVRE
jgi:cytosine/adenosine deaminase-related metal-dependent hydrolase